MATTTYKKTHYIADGIRVLEHYDAATGVYEWKLQSRMFGNWYDVKNGVERSYTNTGENDKIN
jgi:hypothetical protein